MAAHREPLCPLRDKGCPDPSNDSWHRCFVCGALATQHHHFPSRAQAGKGAKIVAALCQKHHDKITLHQWREGVYRHPDGSLRYYIQNQKGEQQCESIIEAAPAETIPSSETLPAVKESKPAIQYEAVGLRLPENLTREQWEEIASTIQEMVVSIPWWVGDVLVYGQRFGEEMWQAIKERGGANYEKLRKYMWVAERVPIGTRVPMLNWSHHREVADLEPDEQRAWLQRALDEDMTVNQLRVTIKGEEPPDVCPDAPGGKHDWERRCRHCGKVKGSA